MRMAKPKTWIVQISFLLTAQIMTIAGCRHSCNQCHSGSGDTGGPSVGVAPETYPGSGAAALPAVVQGYGGQRTCPVTGAALAGVEKPVAVTVNGETVYVCCQNCANKVRMNPEPYLTKARAERAGGSAALAAKSVAATSTLPLGGQKSCPVTGEPLDPSSAVAVTVRGQTIYVCCQGCAAKVRRDPETYLAKVMAERASPNGSHP